MIYLSVPPNADRWETVKQAGIGVMMTPKSGMSLDKTLRFGVWAADNGCYAQGNSFSLVKYLNWLRLMAPAKTSCLFATAPDVVGNARATWERSKDVLPLLRELGYKAALVGQDGMQDLAVEWDAFDVLFIGGSTEWKLSHHAYEIVTEAKRRGKWCHMGRVNSRRRLVAAAVSGYDSADGTHVAFGPDKRLPEILCWIAELQRQSRFVEWVA